MAQPTRKETKSYKETNNGGAVKGWELRTNTITKGMEFYWNDARHAITLNDGEKRVNLYFQTDEELRQLRDGINALLGE